MKRFTSVTSVALLLAITIIGCTQAPREVRVAILAPLSGAESTSGASSRDGALLAIREWNAHGGVLGVAITPLVEDSQCSAQSAMCGGGRTVAR